MRLDHVQLLTITLVVSVVGFLAQVAGQNALGPPEISRMDGSAGTAWQDSVAAAPLDLTGYSLVWSDEFTSRGITQGDRSGPGPWYAGAQGGPYGVASVGPAVRSDVYRVSDGVLTIRATARLHEDGTRNGKWVSGHLQTVNSKGEGFAIQNGYFEARMKFPASVAAWPAFWLKHRNKWTDSKALNIEIDVVEWYGSDAAGHHHGVHIGQGAGRRYWGNYRGIKNRLGRRVELSTDWHTHGALISDDWIVVYLDRVELARFPMMDAFRTPLYPQLTLSVARDRNTKLVAPEAQSPMDLLVDYVRVYAPVDSSGRR